MSVCSRIGIVKKVVMAGAEKVRIPELKRSVREAFLANFFFAGS